jgi:hypothetical protein
MRLLCTGCYEEFNERDIIDAKLGKYTIGYCRDCNGKVVEVDELMMPAIIELNKKGWTTLFCCSGHMNDSYIYTYIKFEHRPNTCPDSFYIDESCIRAKNPVRYIEGIEGFDLWVSLNRDLYEWALSLPDKEEKFNEFN